MTTSNGSGHVVDLLPAYLNGSLSTDDHLGVERHLVACARCQAELDEWHAISEGSLSAASSVAEPSSHLLERIRARIQQPGILDHSQHVPDLSFGARYVWQLLVGQIPLVHRGIWAAVPVTMAIGIVLVLFMVRPEDSGTLLALVAPFVAAVSMTLIYGPENDPSLELALSTATSPRLVLLARMTLVFGYDLLLALGATSVVATMGGGTGLWPLIAMWIGPMLFLSGLALAMSLYFGPTVAVSSALALWSVRVFSMTPNNSEQGTTSNIADLVNAFWNASPLLITLFAGLTLLVLISMPQRERFA